MHSGKALILMGVVGVRTFWARAHLPDANEFDEKNDFQQMTRRIVDGSCQDFGHMAKLLSALDQQRLERNPSSTCWSRPVTCGDITCGQ